MIKIPERGLLNIYQLNVTNRLNYSRISGLARFMS